LTARGALGALAGAVLIGAMFLNWYSPGEALDILEMLEDEADRELPVSAGDLNVTGWEAFRTVDLLLLLSGLAAIGAGLSLALRRGLARRQGVRRDLAGVLIAAGLLAGALIIYRWIDLPLEPLVGTLTPQVGLFIGLAAAIVMVVAGVLAFALARRGEPVAPSAEA
jgi:hypothetical protein